MEVVGVLSLRVGLFAVVLVNVAVVQQVAQQAEQEVGAGAGVEVDPIDSAGAAVDGDPQDAVDEQEELVERRDDAERADVVVVLLVLVLIPLLGGSCAAGSGAQELSGKD